MIIISTVLTLLALASAACVFGAFRGGVECKIADILFLSGLYVFIGFLINKTNRKPQEPHRMCSLRSSGSQQFSCYSGFGDSFEWAGPNEDTLKRYEHPLHALWTLNAFGFLTNSISSETSGVGCRGRSWPLMLWTSNTEASSTTWGRSYGNWTRLGFSILVLDLNHFLLI